LRGLDEAVAAVVPILKRHYLPTHVVFGSLRLIDRHFHLHLFPVTARMEQDWRSLMGEGYETGRFFEFLGHHERMANERDALERAETGVSSIDQRQAWTERLKPEVGRLRQLSAESGSESA
jgi:hypothetical protein